jgi:hypothetical protein
MKNKLAIIASFILLHLTLIHAQISGCNDPLAINFNPSAIINDGSCVYTTVTITPIISNNLPSSLSESSGLIIWNDTIYTHNDNTDKKIYGLNTTNTSIVKTYSISNSRNIDWEEISQDSGFIYLGDFGNNANGNRTDLKIYKINKTSLWTGSPLIDSIKFSYSNQFNFNPTGSNNTNFDCEAFIVGDDSIFIFTKQWIDKKTSVYSLPKQSGNYVAQLKQTFDVQGLITGATFFRDSNNIVLCGYNSTLQPFFYLLYDYPSNLFFSGNKRKLMINLSFHQIEGVATNDGHYFYASNELFNQSSFFNIPQKLHKFNLSEYLYPQISTDLNKHITQTTINIFPSVSDSKINISLNDSNDKIFYKIYNALLQAVQEGCLTKGKNEIELNNFKTGIYYLVADYNGGRKYHKFIKN